MLSSRSGDSFQTLRNSFIFGRDLEDLILVQDTQIASCKEAAGVDRKGLFQFKGGFLILSPIDKDESLS